MTPEPFYLDPEFWVAVAFVAFILLACRPIGRMLFKSLDSRSAQIAQELEQARRLRAEAQAILAMYQQKQQESLKEAEEILAGAKSDAAKMTQQAEVELNAAVEKRMKMAMEKIAQSEVKALQDVQNHVVDIATAAARAIISDYIVNTGNDEIVKQSAAELERKLH